MKKQSFTFTLSVIAHRDKEAYFFTEQSSGHSVHHLLACASTIETFRDIWWSCSLEEKVVLLFVKNLTDTE